MNKYLPILEPLFKQYFSGLHVLEVGCSCGVYGLPISEVAKQYVGLDKSEKMYEISTRTLQGIGNACAMCGSLSNRDIIYAEGFFDMFTLYSYNDQDIEWFLAALVPNCKAAIIVMKDYERKPGRYYNTYDFHDPLAVAGKITGAGMKLVDSDAFHKGKTIVMGFKR